MNLRDEDFNDPRNAAWRLAEEAFDVIDDPQRAHDEGLAYALAKIELANLLIRLVD